jgi:AcrR family transcriptional regulator
MKIVKTQSKESTAVAARRSYSSALRDQQARLTRRRVLDAAGELFLTDGYLGTTIDAVARRAGVSTQTVYNAVGGKAALLRAVYDVSLAGDDEPVPIAERPAFRAMLAETDGRRCLARYAELSRELWERAGPLVVRLLSQAAAGDPDLRAFADTAEGQRATGTAMVAGHVAERFGLRPGLTAREAGDALWVLTAPEVLERLVVGRGWSLDRAEAWLAEAMADALLGPGGYGRRPPATRATPGKSSPAGDR